jgi:molybdate transport repressor ModE-like protein
MVTKTKDENKTLTTEPTETRMLQPNARLSIRGKDTPFHDAFTVGAAALLEGVQKYGSIRAAALSIDMSYARARDMIHDTEANLGFKLTRRGDTRQFCLTKEGQIVLDDYHAAIAAAEKAINEVLQSRAEERSAAGGSDSIVYLKGNSQPFKDKRKNKNYASSEFTI